MPKQSVYLMKNEFDLFKIGVSKNPFKRARTISLSSGLKTSVSRTYTPDRDTAYLIEQELHRRYRSCRMHGEWFAKDLSALFLVECKEINDSINDDDVYNRYSDQARIKTTERLINFVKSYSKPTFYLFNCCSRDVLRLAATTIPLELKYMTEIANTLRLALILCSSPVLNRNDQLIDFGARTGIEIRDMDRTRVCENKATINEVLLKSIFDFIGVDIFLGCDEISITQNHSSEKMLAGFIRTAKRYAEDGHIDGLEFGVKADIHPYKILAEYLLSGEALKISRTGLRKAGLSQSKAGQLAKSFDFDLLQESMGSADIEIFKPTRRTTTPFVRLCPKR